MAFDLSNYHKFTDIYPEDTTIYLVQLTTIP